MALHVLGHVEAQELDAHGRGELARDFGLADAGGTGEQEAAHGLALLAQPGARHLDRGRQRLDGRILAEDHQLQVALEVAQHFLVGGGDRLGRDARDARDHVLDLRHIDDAAAFGNGLQARARARLVDHVDGLVGQVPVVDVARGQFRRRLDGAIGIGDAVVLLVARLAGP